jgi:hypothetical protein
MVKRMRKNVQSVKSTLGQQIPDCFCCYLDDDEEFELYLVRISIRSCHKDKTCKATKASNYLHEGRHKFSPLMRPNYHPHVFNETQLLSRCSTNNVEVDLYFLFLNFCYLDVEEAKTNAMNKY